MSLSDEIVQRWKANTAALGIRLTDEDIERIAAGGLGARHADVAAILQRADCQNSVPDYLAETREVEVSDE